MLILRADLLASSSTFALLAPRALPHLRAAALVRGGLTAARRLPAPLFAQICLHTTFVSRSNSSGKHGKGSNITNLPGARNDSGNDCGDFEALAAAAAEFAEASGALVAINDAHVLVETAWTERDANDVAMITTAATAAAKAPGAVLIEGAVARDESTSSSSSSLGAASEWDDPTTTLPSSTLTPAASLLCVHQDDGSNVRVPQPPITSVVGPPCLTVSSEFAPVASGVADASSHLRPKPLSIDNNPPKSAKQRSRQQQERGKETGPGQLRIVRRRRVGVRAGDKDESSSVERAVVAGADFEGDDDDEESFEVVDSELEIDLEATCVMVDGSRRSSSSSDGWLLASDNGSDDDSMNGMNSMGPTPMARHSGFGNGNGRSGDAFSLSWPDAPLNGDSPNTAGGNLSAAATTAVIATMVEAAATTFTVDERSDGNVDVWSTSSSSAQSPRVSPAPLPWPLPTAISEHERKGAGSSAYPALEVREHRKDGSHLSLE